MIPAMKRDWCRETDPAGFPCPSIRVARRASHFAGGVRGMCRGTTSSNGYRYSMLRLTCQDPADLVDQQKLEIPVRGAAPILLEVERTAGYTPTAGYTTLDLVTAATSVDIANVLGDALELAPQVTSGRVRLFRNSAAGASTVDLVARDAFVMNRHGITRTVGIPIEEPMHAGGTLLRFGTGDDDGNRDPWKVVRCGPHRRFVRCLVQSERIALRPQV